MAKRDEAVDPIVAQVTEAGEAERRLLRRERRAERDLDALLEQLAVDEERLERARRRVEERRAEIAEAEARLRRRQADRAAGPGANNGVEPSQGGGAEPDE